MADNREATASEETHAGAAPLGYDASKHDVERASRHSDDTDFVPAGVNRISAFYETFSTKPKLAGFALAFICWMFAYTLSADTTYVYLPFATSAFSAHTIIGTISTVSLIVAAVIQPFWSKIADLFSRPLALAFATLFYAVGYAVVAGSKTVTDVAGGQVVYAVGNSGLSFMQTLILADITPLKYRGLAFGVVSIPYIPFAFVAGYITDAVTLANWRWGFGMMSILLTACVIPIIATLYWADWKAKKEGVLSVAASSIAFQTGLRGSEEQVGFLAKARRAASITDAFGLLLLGFCFALLLSPTTLSSSATNGWKNPSLIAMQTVGGVLFIAFCFWEWRIAAHPIMPRRVMNRTFVMSLVINFFFYLTAYLTDVYWASWLYVIRPDLSTRDYTYMNQIQTVTLCLFGVIGGLIQTYTRRYKWLQVFGLGVRIIGSAINYWSTTGHTNIATLFFAKFLLCAGAGVSVIASQIAAQGSVKHKDLALSIAILALFTQSGGAVGSAISASVWNDQLPKQIAKYCPDLTPEQVSEVFGSIAVAATTEPQEGIYKAYNAAFRLLSIPALCTIFIPFIAACCSANYVLDNRHNTVEDKIVTVHPQPEHQAAEALARAEHERRPDSEAGSAEEKAEEKK
ncbi:unnamed protein product [Parajaminaea phylloscopi]